MWELFRGHGVRIVNKGTGIDAAVAHVRRRRIQGCLIRQVMIAKDGTGTGTGTGN